MNSWLVLLLLLFGNQNGRGNDSDSGCRRGSNGSQPRFGPGGRDWNDDTDGDCGCDGDNNRGRNRDFDGDFGRGRNFDNDGDNGFNNESRFESRFDARPFDNSGCNNQ